MRLFRLLIITLLAAFPMALHAQQEPSEDPDLKWATELLKQGEQAPDFTLADLRGKQRSLSEFRGRKVVLVFWASWCPDCRAEVPQLKAMQAESDPSRVAFVSVSFDRDFDTLCAFVDDNAIGGVQLFDPAGKKDSKVGDAFHVKWIPSLYLIDEQGKVELSTVVAEKVAAALRLSSKPSAQTRSGQGVCTDETCSL